MLVLMISESCATETAKVAGTIFASTRLTPGWASARSGSSPMRGIMSMRLSPGHCTANCSSPPTITAQASAKTGIVRCGATNAAATMNATFSSTGANAGSEKFL